MKRTVLPLGFDGAYLQPRDYIPGCAQTTYVSYDNWVMGVEIENAQSDFYTSVVERFVAEIVRPLASKIEALLLSVKDDQAKQRQRSRDDLNRKRREMRRRKGRLA